MSENIGPYRLLGELGRGGMGVVHRALHDQTGVEVALKTLLLPNERLLRSLRREIHALSRLRHPGIVRILDAGTHQNLPWYAMELLTGRSLRAWMSAQSPSPEATVESQTVAEPAATLRSDPNAPLPMTTGAPLPEARLPEALTLLRCLCATLAALHGEGLVHRDLKPENIWVRPDNTPVLVDFGLANQYIAAGGREPLQVAAALEGTIYYMAPEQIQGEAVDARADLYSLGCIFYELLSGRKPFDSKHATGVLRGHLSLDFEPLSTLVPWLSKGLERLVAGLLVKERRGRLGYAEDVALRLASLGASAPPPPFTPPPKRYLYRPSLSGRGPQLELLRAALRATRAQEGCFLFLQGESGSGKTRLAVELLREASAMAYPCLAGACEPGEEGVPLGALRAPLQTIVDYCQEKGAAEADRVLGHRGPVIARYLPSLQDLPGQRQLPEPPELPPEAARLRLFSALGELFYAYSREGPLVLFLDDLQWADPLTLDLLRFLLRGGLLSRSLLLLGAYRSEEESLALKGLLSSPNVKRLSLERLDDSAIVEVAAEMLAVPTAPEALASFLQQNAQGNPLFVGEYLRAAIEDGLLQRDPEGRWQLADTPSAALLSPRSLLSLLSRRLSSLSPKERAFLAAFAVLGRDLELALAEQLGPPEVLEELLRQRLLEESPPGYVSFTHDKLREAILAEIDAPALAGLHLAAAERLVSSYGAQFRPAVVGYHWEQAGERGRAQRAYLSGAREARRAAAYQESEGLYHAFLALEAPPSLARISVLLELGEEVLAPRGKNQDALDIFHRALEEARALSQASSEVLALCAIGALYTRGGKREEAEPYLLQALSLSQSLERVDLESKTLLWLARLYTSWRSEEAIAMIQQVMTNLEEYPNESYSADALLQLGNLHTYQGRLTEALSFFQQASEAAQRAKEHTLYLRSLTNAANVYGRLGQPREAERLYQEALRRCKEAGDRFVEANVYCNIAVLYANEGKLVEARSFYESALSITNETQDRPLEGILCVNLAELNQTEGHYQEALSLYRRALDLSRQVKNLQLEGYTLEKYAKLSQSQGDFTVAQTLYQEALSLHQQNNDLRYQGETLLSLSSLARLLQQNEEAERLLESAASLLFQSEDKSVLVGYYCEQGHLRLARHASAKECIEQVKALLSELNAGPESVLVGAFFRLERAQEAFEANEAASLFQGERWEDFSERARRALLSH